MNKKTLLIALCSLVLLSSVSSFAADTPGSSFKKANAKVEKEITLVLDTLNKAYLEENIDDALSIVANDDTVVFIGTTIADKFKGIQELKIAFAQDFENLKTVSAEYPWVDITTNGKIALVAADFIGNCETASGEVEKVSARQTLVLEKIKGKWLILQSHFSFPVETIQKAMEDKKTKEDMENEIDEDLDDMPMKDEHIGKEIQEEITDDKLVDEDA